jgi:hypothetical protein
VAGDVHATTRGGCRLLALDGDLARAEPKTLRYKILHAAARLARGGRRRRRAAVLVGWRLIVDHRSRLAYRVLLRRLN